MSSPIATGYSQAMPGAWRCEEHGPQRTFVWLDQPGQPPFTNYCQECVATVVKEFLTPMECNNV